MEREDTLGSFGMGPTRARGLRWLRCRRRLLWAALAVAVLCVCQGGTGWGWGASQKSGNAADGYRRAFEEIARLPDADATLPGPDQPLLPNSKSEEIVARLGPALKCLHEATADSGDTNRY